MRITTFLLAAACAAACAQDPPTVNTKLEPASFEVPAAAWKGVQREGATLAWKPQVGQVTGYRANSSMQLIQDYGLEDVKADPVDITSAQSYRLEVLEVTNAHVMLRCTSLELVIELSAAGMVMTTDTRDGTRSGNPGLDLFADMVGEPFTLKVTRSGQVVGIEDAADLHKRLQAKSPLEDLNVAETVNADRLAQELQPFFGEFGPAELKSGERWAVERKLQAAPGQTFNGVQTYVYLGIAEHEGVKCAKLIGQFSLKAQENANPGPNGVGKVVAEGQPFALYVGLTDGVVLGSEPQALAVAVDQNLTGGTGKMTLTSTTSVTALSAEALATDGKKPDWNKKPPR